MSCMLRMEFTNKFSFDHFSYEGMQFKWIGRNGMSMNRNTRNSTSAARI